MDTNMMNSSMMSQGNNVASSIDTNGMQQMMRPMNRNRSQSPTGQSVRNPEFASPALQNQRTTSAL